MRRCGGGGGAFWSARLCGPGLCAFLTARRCPCAPAVSWQRQLSEGVKTLSAEERVTLMKQVQAGHAWLGSLSPQHEAGLGVW